jgi:hypothetical protein
MHFETTFQIFGRFFWVISETHSLRSRKKTDKTTICPGIFSDCSNRGHRGLPNPGKGRLWQQHKRSHPRVRPLLWPDCALLSHRPLQPAQRHVLHCRQQRTFSQGRRSLRALGACGHSPRKPVPHIAIRRSTRKHCCVNGAENILHLSIFFFFAKFSFPQIFSYFSVLAYVMHAFGEHGTGSVLPDDTKTSLCFCKLNAPKSVNLSMQGKTRMFVFVNLTTLSQPQMKERLPTQFTAKDLESATTRLGAVTPMATTTVNTMVN